MTGTDKAIRWSTAAAVIGVAVVAAVVSYEHAYALVHAHGETGWTAHLIPLTVDGLIWASSMVMLDSARRGVRVPALARWLLGLGIAATLAANVTHGLGPRPNRCRSGCVASGGARRLVRTVGDDHSRDPAAHGRCVLRDQGSVGRRTGHATGPSRRGVRRRRSGRSHAVDSGHTRKAPRRAATRPAGARVPRRTRGRLGQSRGHASVPGKPEYAQRACVRGPRPTNWA